MVDREKVIKALERCATKGCGCDDEEGCPYNKGMDYSCVAELVNDALVLLKAQKSRVMTLDEALEADYVYLEVRIHTNIPCCILAFDEDGDIVPLQRGFSGILDAASYGKGWRCWTSRPDDAAREATPWE